MAVVQVEELSKHFGAVKAVDGVSLAVESGEVVSLLGPSGCGKTTTLRCIAGLERPDGWALPRRSTSSRAAASWPAS